jgi:hypothetical protein
MPRFVILRHDDSRGEHFDFMLETAGDVLKTWALPRSPEIGVQMDCEALADHRIEYLDYEGPISGGRGVVGRWDRGAYTLERHDETQWIVQLDGEIIAGQATLCRNPNDSNRWRFSLAETEHGSPR